METIERIESYTRWLDKILLTIAATLLTFSVTLVMYSVIMRFLFQVTYVQVDELSRYAIIFSVFAYIGPLIKIGSHIKMDLLPNLLKGRIKYSLDLVINLLLVFGFIVLFWNGIKYAESLQSINMKSPSGFMMLYIPAIAVPLGMFFSIVYSLQQVILNIFKIRFHKSNNQVIEENVLEEHTM